jgi:Domain of unknown function (DUF4249)
MKNIILLLSISVLVTSCTKILDIDLNNAAPKIVIEGIVTDQMDGLTVKISKTVNFSSTNVYPPVKGATVEIKDDKGSIFKLIETNPGYYTIKNVKGVSGNTYILKVIAEGIEYTSKSTMPYSVDFKKLEVKESDFNRPSDTFKLYEILPIFDDPIQFQNNYKFNLYKNNLRDKTTNVINDNLINGIANPIPILNSDNFKIEKGDKLTVEMLCIDSNVYLYFYNLLSGDPNQSGTPANPESNITGGALGYFSAHTTRKLDVVVQ